MGINQTTLIVKAIFGAGITQDNCRAIVAFSTHWGCNYVEACVACFDGSCAYFKIRFVRKLLFFQQIEAIGFRQVMVSAEILDRFCSEVAALRQQLWPIGQDDMPRKFWINGFQEKRSISFRWCEGWPQTFWELRQLIISSGVELGEANE